MKTVNIPSAEIAGLVQNNRIFLSKNDLVAWLLQCSQENKELDDLFAGLAKAVSSVSPEKPK